MCGLSNRGLMVGGPKKNDMYNRLHGDSVRIPWQLLAMKLVFVKCFFLQFDLKIICVIFQ